MPTSKICIDCGTLTNATRCPPCKTAKDRQRPQRPTNTTRTTTERKRRTAAVNQHRAEHGDWCPGYLVEPHPSTDLTADHVTSIAAGGAPDGPLQVLCRRCNSRKADR